MKVPEMPGTRVLIKPIEQRRSQGGIELPQSIQGVAALRGTVVVVGPDCKFAKVADEVSFALYSKYIVPEIEGFYKNWLLVNEEDILFKWVEDGKPEPEESKIWQKQ